MVIKMNFVKVHKNIYDKYKIISPLTAKVQKH